MLKCIFQQVESCKKTDENIELIIKNFAECYDLRKSAKPLFYNDSRLDCIEQDIMHTAINNCFTIFFISFSIKILLLVLLYII